MKYFKHNVNKNTTNQNFWDATKTEQREIHSFKMHMLGKMNDGNQWAKQSFCEIINRMAK